MFLRPPVVRITNHTRHVLPRPHKLTRVFASASIDKIPESSPVRSPQDTRPRSATRRRDVIKRKVAVMFGYDGAKYHGLQRNADVETISDVLERALHEVGAISDENLGSLEKVKWQVAARTDRGVSAAGNVVSAKLLFRKDEHEAGDSFQRTTDRLNNFLPDEVQVFGIKHITKSFSARNSCDERWYEYLLPSVALNGEKSVESFAQVLGHYEGSHSFHNFTVGVDHSIPPRPQARRFITKATCDFETVSLPYSGTDQNISHSDWVRIRVRGQSFMLHQIRKMVTLAILTHNGAVPADAIEKSFCGQTLINVPPAPAVGLFLDCCHFGWYNERHKTVLPEPLSLSLYDSARESFKSERVFPSIAQRSVSEDALDVFYRTVELHPVHFP